MRKTALVLSIIMGAVTLINDFPMLMLAFNMRGAGDVMIFPVIYALAGVMLIVSAVMTWKKKTRARMLAIISAVLFVFALAASSEFPLALFVFEMIIAGLVWSIIVIIIAHLDMKKAKSSQEA